MERRELCQTIVIYRHTLHSSVRGTMEYLASVHKWKMTYFARLYLAKLFRDVRVMFTGVRRGCDDDSRSV